MDRRALLLAILAALTVARPAAASPNKLLNSGFQNDLSHWTLVSDPAFAITYSPWFGHTAGGSLVVTASGVGPVNHVVFRQIVNVRPSSSYSFGTYFYTAADSATTPYAAVAVNWLSGLDGTGTLAGYAATDFTPSGPAGTWLSCQLAAISPALAKSAVVDFVVKTNESKTALAVFDEPFFWGNASAGVVGDANGDTKIDIGDVFFLVNYLFSNGPRPIGPSDVNNDLEVDVSDVFYLINYLFGGGNAPMA
jgi:Dockerin type I domain